MNRSFSKIFFGALFVGLGFTILFSNELGVLWDKNFSYLPVIFILFGIGLLPHVNYVIKLLLTILLGITVSLWLVSNYYGCQNEITKISGSLISDNYTKTHTNEVSKDGSVIHNLPYSQDDEEVELNVQTAVSKFSVMSDSIDENVLFYANSNKEGLRHEMDVKQKGRKKEINYFLSSVSMGSRSPVQVKAGMKGLLDSEVKLQLHRNPVWDVNVEMGVASGNFDLTAYKVRNFSVEAGASSIQIKLGDLLNYSKIKIEVGASSVNIMIPKSVSCHLEVESGLSGFEAQGFIRRGELEYFSQGSMSGKDIFIEVEQGLSSLNIERY